MRTGWVVLVVGALVGCTSTRMVKRDDCWVKQETRWPGQVKENLGICSRAEPKWAEDRLTRVVQECVAQADYRWQNRAIASWNRGDRPPEGETEEQALDRCIKEAPHMVVVENEALKDRLADVKSDREHIRTSNARLADALGEAAKKPGTVTATASARGDGTSSTKNDSTTETVGYPQMVMQPVRADSAKPVKAVPRRARKPKPARPECDPVASPVKAKANEIDAAPAAIPATPATPAPPATPAVAPTAATK
jgi:hypothetical protein